MASASASTVVANKMGRDRAKINSNIEDARAKSEGQSWVGIKILIGLFLLKGRIIKDWWAKLVWGKKWGFWGFFVLEP